MVTWKGEGQGEQGQRWLSRRDAAIPWEWNVCELGNRYFAKEKTRRGFLWTRVSKHQSAKAFALLCAGGDAVLGSLKESSARTCFMFSALCGTYGFARVLVMTGHLMKSL